MVRRNLPVFEIIGDVLLLPEYAAAREAQEQQKVRENFLGEMPKSGLYDAAYVEMNAEEVYDQLAKPTTDWRGSLRDHVLNSTGWVRPVTMAPGTYWEDTSHKLSEEFLQNFFNEVQGIMANPGVNCQVFFVDEDGNLVEQK